MQREAGEEGAPRWRAILDARGRDRVEEVTELSLAYHGAADTAGAGEKQARRLLRRTVAARRRLADVEDALARLAAGNFGKCEQCAAQIPVTLLAAAPESRYCPGCAADARGAAHRRPPGVPARSAARAGRRS